MNPNTPNLDDKAVLVTGCSSGIGRQTALTLAKHGLVVFATVRKEADAENLRNLSLPNLVPLCPLDLTNPEHISNISKLVAKELDRRGMNGLYALINNAGGGSPSPLELMELDQFRTELQARVWGSVAMIQTFLPFIRQAKGRIVWIMTPALMPTPYVASIHACDFAINCIARTLDIELKPWGVPNIMIKCGGIKTPAGLRTTMDVEAVLQKGPREKISLYEKALREWAKDMAEFDKKRTEPEKVAEIVLEALVAKRPKRRYSIGYMVQAASFLELLPQSAADWILKMRF
ncbi:MAG TPA: SDR family NAD(P)-dependent oxidoreductase [Anaerolineales bacterium]|nr:SDR family NAD(P)-dependent oxidoreductase [Anaerolineales bacterium]